MIRWSRAGALVCVMTLWLAAPSPNERARAQTMYPAWTEVTWPFLLDQWGTGRAFTCQATNCGSSVSIYLRAKVGFCSCSTGVADDDEIDRVGDLDLLGESRTALASGNPIRVGWMAGRERTFLVEGPLHSKKVALEIAVSNKCDAVVATVVSERQLAPDIEQAALRFLGGDTVLRWAEASTGLE
jgi:hypothetical protein